MKRKDRHADLVNILRHHRRDLFFSFDKISIDDLDCSTAWLSQTNDPLISRYGHNHSGRIVQSNGQRT